MNALAPTLRFFCVCIVMDLHIKRLDGFSIEVQPIIANIVTLIFEKLKENN